MENKNTFDNLAKKITDLLPDNFKQVQQDVESNVKAVLQNSLSKMNLVSRDEFDIQSALLARTREKLDLMEKQLNEMAEK